jgi:hypothetical protein
MINATSITGNTLFMDEINSKFPSGRKFSFRTSLRTRATTPKNQA